MDHTSGRRDAHLVPYELVETGETPAPILLSFSYAHSFTPLHSPLSNIELEESNVAGLAQVSRLPLFGRASTTEKLKLP